jgi:hypothetical protein
MCTVDKNKYEYKYICLHFVKYNSDDLHAVYFNFMSHTSFFHHDALLQNLIISFYLDCGFISYSAVQSSAYKSTLWRTCCSVFRVKVGRVRILKKHITLTHNILTLLTTNLKIGAACSSETLIPRN